MTNLYHSPEPLEEARQRRASSVARTAFFAVNFAGGILGLAAAILMIVGPCDSPFAFLGGIILLGPCIAFAVAEWSAFYRHNWRMERILGRVMFGLAAFTVFGVVTNVGEALLPAKPDRHAASIEFMVWFVAIGTAIALYFGCCGLFRIRHSRGS